MKIKSNYVDYYDKVANIYGGGDPKIVYVRPYKHVEIPDFDADKGVGKLGRDYYKVEALNKVDVLISRNNHDENIRIGQKEEITYFRVIIIGDTLFTQIKRENDKDYRLVRESDLRNKPDNKTNSKYHFWWEDRKQKQLKLSDFINHKDPLLIDVCKKMGLPVFMIETVRRKYNKNFDRYTMKFETSEVMPNLGKIGIGNFIDANTMYQNISYLVGNLIKESPDTMPPIIIDDKYKIIGHGFDIKKSFRNMK